MGSLARAERTNRCVEAGSAPRAAAAEHAPALEAEARDVARRIAAEPSPPAPPPADGPLPPRSRAYFENRLGEKLPDITLRTDAAEAHAQGARGFARGSEIVFGAKPDATLLAHEVTHVAQQAAGRAPHGLQRDPDPAEAAAEAAADAKRDAEMVEVLSGLPEFDPAAFVDEAGSLLELEARFPKAAAIIMPRLEDSYGAEAVATLRDHDDMVFDILLNAEIVLDAIDDMASRFHDEDKDYAWEHVWELRPQYELGFATLARSVADWGGFSLVFYGLAGNDPDEAAAMIEAEALRIQGEMEFGIEVGEELVGTTLATREVLMWFDETITLESVIGKPQGEATHAAALLRARISGKACAVIERKGRWYVLTLDHQYSLADALASGFDKRTEIVEAAGAPNATIVTTDGVPLRQDGGTRFFVEKNLAQEERLADDLAYLEANRENLGVEQKFTIFRELLRDAIFANLERSKGVLVKQRGRFFDGPIPHFSTMDAKAGAQLQRDTAALREHMLAVGEAASIEAEEMTPDERVGLETHLFAIGLIHTRSPLAAIFVANHRDPDSSEPPEPDELEDTLAGLGTGDVIFKAIGEIDLRLGNIERVRQHLLENPEAALDFEPLHAALLVHFDKGEQLYFRGRLAYNSLARLAGVLGMIARDLALIGLGTLIGGPVGFAIAALPVASGVAGTVEAFEHADLVQSMAQLDITGEFAMALPEMASSARRWAWIALGLTVIDVAGFAGGAAAAGRLRAVLASSDVEALLRLNRATLADAADAMGMSVDDLNRQLARATGAERKALIGRIRSATTPTAAGGRAGYMGDWGFDFTDEQLLAMRAALVARTDDIAPVGDAVRAMGHDIDDAMIATIKQYNFDSPGLHFARMNYEAWNRLAAGTGTIGDVRYILHEAEEVTRLQAVKKRTGFDFLEPNYDKMTRAQQQKWQNTFNKRYHMRMSESLDPDDLVPEDVGHYVAAHGHALRREFEFMAEQANRLSGGQTSMTDFEAAALDATYSGANAREALLLDGVPLSMHKSFDNLRRNAGQTVTLSPDIRAELGSGGIFDALELAYSRKEFYASTRPLAIANGEMEPTVAEFLAIIRALPAGF